MAFKTSILIFYLRLAKNTQVILRYASWATLVVVNVAGIVLTFMNVFQCDPTSAAWNSDLNGSARCIPLLTEFICAAPVNIVTDLAILAMPIPVLTGMRLPSRQKTILVFTFTLGIFVTIVDVVRIYYLQRAILEVPTGSSTDPLSRFGGQSNFAWNASLSLMWSAVEVNVGMACACVPTLKPLILKLLPAMLYDPDGTRNLSPKGPSDSDNPPSRPRGSLTYPPPVAAPTGTQPVRLGGSEAPISAMEFLTTPDMAPPAESSPDDAPARIPTDVTASASTAATQGNAVYFGFVNMSRPKSMLRTNGAESFKYCTIVSILFFLWGVSYGLLNTLNNVVASVNNMTTAETLGLTSIYFGAGYFFGPLLVGEWILRRDEHNRSRRHRKAAVENVGGFKVTFIVGLCIYGVGTIIFWPSAVTSSWGGFMLSNFIVGFGLSVLEVGANAFMILCGPPQYGETRLLLAQGVQGVGSVLSGLLAQKVFFNGIVDNDVSNSLTLINVQWTYLGITLLCVILALFFYYMPLPEVSDDELAQTVTRLPVDPQKKSVFGLELRTVSLVLAVLCQYMYVGAQESNSIFFRSLLISILPDQESSGHKAASGTANSSDPERPQGITLSTSDYLLIAHSAFAVSRFLVAYLTYLSVFHPRLPKPRTLLAISVGLCFLFALLPVVLHPANANLLVIPVILFFFAQGPIWPLIFAIGLRGQARRTKRAAAFITMGGSGAAAPPFIMFGIITTGGTVQTAFIVVIVLEAIMVAYPIFLEFVKDARAMVDPNPNVRPQSRDEEAPVDEVVAGRVQQNAGPREKASNLLGKVSKGLGAKLAGAGRRSPPAPEVMHTEDSNENRPPPT